MEYYWVWLTLIPGLGPIKTLKLLDKYRTPKAIFELPEEKLLQENYLDKVTIQNILNPNYKRYLNQYLNYMEANEIRIIDIFSQNYPQKLRNIYDPPIVIYVKGNIGILNDISIAVIGCRRYSSYGKDMALKLSYELAVKNFVVISGLARGIDSFSHIGCLKAKGKTIAVLGSGLDYIYPPENRELYSEIIYNGGAIVSEYPVGTKPLALNFPARNRIISGLSNGVLVIESRLKSGTLITTDFALEQGKDIYAVPGNINVNTSEGNNELIKQGAKVVTCAEDILEDFYFTL